MIIKEFKGEYFTINWQVKTWKIVITIPYFSYFKDRKIPTFGWKFLLFPTILTSPTTFHPGSVALNSNSLKIPYISLVVSKTMTDKLIIMW